MDSYYANFVAISGLVAPFQCFILVACHRGEQTPFLSNYRKSLLFFVYYDMHGERPGCIFEKQEH
jgi:hypothetical protein